MYMNTMERSEIWQTLWPLNDPNYGRNCLKCGQPVPAGFRYSHHIDDECWREEVYEGNMQFLTELLVRAAQTGKL